MSRDDDFWTGLFLVFVIFSFMFLTFYHVHHIADTVYEGFLSSKSL